jgi:hypothetical protein
MTMSDMEPFEGAHELKLGVCLSLVYEPVDLRLFLAKHPEQSLGMYKGRRSFTLMYMTANDDMTESAILVLDHKADINGLTNGDNSLILSTLDGGERIARMLLERGAKMHTVRSEKCDAMYWSVAMASHSLTFSILCCGDDAR